jgi:hypothetical protein
MMLRVMMRFDKAAEFLAGHFGFAEQPAQFRDRVWIGESFQEEVRTSDREGERWTLRVEHHSMFFQVTVDRDVTLAELRELLWAVDRALDRE